MNNVWPSIARPRLTRPQHARAAVDGLYAYCQNTRPFVASTATMTLGGCTVYSTPSTTSEVDSYFDVGSAGARVCNTHSSCRFFALSGVICVSGLYRWPLSAPEYVSQFCGS